MRTTVGASEETLSYVVTDGSGLRVEACGALLGERSSLDAAFDLLYRDLYARVAQEASRRGWVRLHAATADTARGRVLIVRPVGSREVHPRPRALSRRRGRSGR